MSIKIKVSFTNDTERAYILTLFTPLLDRFKVKESNGTSPYRHLYFTPKNSEKRSR